MPDQETEQQRRQREQQEQQERQRREQEQGGGGGGERHKPGEVPDDTREVLETAGQQGTQTRRPDEKAEPRRTGTSSTGSPNPEEAQGKAPTGGSRQQ